MAMSAGLYAAKIQKTSFGKNQNGKLNVAIDVEIFGLVNGAAIEQLPFPQSRSLQQWLVSEENQRISVETLRKIGWAGDDFNDFNTGKSGLDGAIVQIRCDHEQYQDKKSGSTKTGERWNFATSNAGQASTKNVVDNSDARQANAQMASILKGSKNLVAKVSKAMPAMAAATATAPVNGQAAQPVGVGASDTNGGNTLADGQEIPF